MAMSTQDLAKQFVAALQKGDEAAAQKFWAEDVVSREPMDGPMREIKGREAVKGKGEWWYANHQVHEMKAMGPYLHGDQFAVEFYVDVTAKADGARRKMHEVGLYTVKDGKIVEERFFA